MKENRPVSKVSRRHFLNKITYGAGGIVLLGSYGFSIRKDKPEGIIKAIAINFEKCTGCRTCETVCSAYNNKVILNGIKMNGPGNPALSNIRVYHYNPDVDIPSTCALCNDAPCIEACPVEPDTETGRKALYRDKDLMCIKNDAERCIACMSCVEACSKESTGILQPDPKTGNPGYLCTLCGGDPQCVKYCPFDALSYIEMPADRKLDALAPDKIAQIMIKKFYEN